MNIQSIGVAEALLLLFLERNKDKVIKDELRSNSENLPRCVKNADFLKMKLTIVINQIPFFTI